MAEYRLLRCPNPLRLSHQVFDRKTKGFTTVSRGVCGAALKLFQNVREFDEIIFCQRCGARMRIARNGRGATTVYFLPKSLRVPHESEPARVVGSSKPSKIIKMKREDFESLVEEATK